MPRNFLFMYSIKLEFSPDTNVNQINFFFPFVLQFVDEKVQWMHIDMAGPVWNEKKKTGTGFGVSTLVEWVLKNSS